MTDFSIGSFVLCDGVKYKVFGVNERGQCVLEDAENGEYMAVSAQYLTPWVDRPVAAPLNVLRYFNIYEGSRVGNLVKDAASAETHASTSHRKRLALGRVVIVQAANGDFTASVEVVGK